MTTAMTTALAQLSQDVRDFAKTFIPYSQTLTLIAQAQRFEATYRRFQAAVEQGDEALALQEFDELRGDLLGFRDTKRIREAHERLNLLRKTYFNFTRTFLINVQPGQVVSYGFFKNQVMRVEAVSTNCAERHICLEYDKGGYVDFPTQNVIVISPKCF